MIVRVSVLRRKTSGGTVKTAGLLERLLRDLQMRKDAVYNKQQRSFRIVACLTS
jgi:hypothetical protein